jgi:hypothetical protein
MPLENQHLFGIDAHTLNVSKAERPNPKGFGVCSCGLVFISYKPRSIDSKTNKPAALEVELEARSQEPLELDQRAFAAMGEIMSL